MVGEKVLRVSRISTVAADLQATIQTYLQIYAESFMGADNKHRWSVS